MNVIFRSILTAAIAVAPTTMLWAQNSNPGNSGGGNSPIAIPTYHSEEDSNPALTTGSRYSVKPDTPAFENPTVPGATGNTIVKGDRSEISLDRRATVQQKTGGSASDAPGG
jgi:hypothetical protein